MTPPTDPRLLVDFFDEQQQSAKYDVLKARTELIDRRAAQMLNAGARGDVLSIGGVWDYFEKGPDLGSLTVVDMSEKMLDAYAPPGSKKIRGDFYVCDFEPGKFDTIVFPLILHHVAEGEGSTWAFCKRRISDAFALAARWVKPGGSIFVMEYCPHPAWIPIQGALVPVTKRFLRAVGQPLVAMHSRDFYLAELSRASLSPRAVALETDGFTWRSWYPLFMATPWLKVPFAVFPKPYVFVGTRGS